VKMPRIQRKPFSAFLPELKNALLLHVALPLSHAGRGCLQLATNTFLRGRTLIPPRQLQPAGAASYGLKADSRGNLPIRQLTDLGSSARVVKVQRQHCGGDNEPFRCIIRAQRTHALQTCVAASSNVIPARITGIAAHGKKGLGPKPVDSNAYVG
jgi:hypothetical protein